MRRRQQRMQRRQAAGRLGQHGGRTPCLLLPVILSVGLALGADAPARAGARNLEGVVNLNTAPVEVLGLLPGIGPSKARGIVAYRTRRPFRTVDELVRVKGIGRRMVRELRVHLATAGPSTARGFGDSRGEGPVAPAAAAPPPARPRPPNICRPATLVAPRPLANARVQSSRDRRLIHTPANHCAPPA
ncbi:MAG: helix-hairpin-helix domain-containing protein [Myxococcales bacterium]